MARVLFLCVLILMVAGALSIFQYPCGPECEDENCYIDLGCTNCKPQYCTHFAGTKSVCLLECPSGYRCMETGGKRICTRR